MLLNILNILINRSVEHGLPENSVHGREALFHKLMKKLSQREPKFSIKNKNLM